MEVKCNFCGEQKKIRSQGDYAVKSRRGDEEKLVKRFFCKSCGRTFSEHTRILPFVRRGRRAKGIKFQSEIEVRYIGSRYREEKARKLRSEITDYVVSYGLPKIGEIVGELGISSKTYYKYLQDLSSALEHDFVRQRAKLNFQNMMLIEWSEQHEKVDFKTRFLILVDSKTKIIFNVFFHEKKRQTPALGVPNNHTFEQQALRKLDYTYNTEHISRHLLALKEKHPKLQLYLFCSKYLKERLVTADPTFFKIAKQKHADKFLAELQDYGFNKTVKLALLNHKKKYARYKSFPKSITKRHIRNTCLNLISLYNAHQIQVAQMDKRKKQKPQHRRLRKQDRHHKGRGKPKPAEV